MIPNVFFMMESSSIILLICFAALVPGVGSREEYERHPNDGWYNNLLHPDWGAVDSILLRRSATKYSDGVYEPSGPERPNPLQISLIAFNGTNNYSAQKRNAMLVFFGQQLVEEIMDAQSPGCPMEYFNIPVPKNHKYNPNGIDDLEMPFLRARYDQRTGHSLNNPRQQLNEITPYIDGNLIYGTGKAVEDALREFKGGRLLSDSSNVKDSFPVKNDIRLPYANPPSPRDHFLRPVKRFRRFGNPRTHENPFLTSLAVVWFRYHNHIAKEISEKNSMLDDEQIFNAARKRVIAQYQKITWYEWLAAWLGIDELQKQYEYNGTGSTKHSYRGYDPNVHPGISAEFQAAAMRFGHTLVPSGVVLKDIESSTCTDFQREVKARFNNERNEGDETVKVKGVRLCNSYWLPEETLEDLRNGMDMVIRGMIYTKAAKEDNIIVSDIREDVFGALDWSRRDIGALNIQRGRDLGLPGYNDVREAYGLPRKTDWKSINPQYSQILEKLRELYGNTAAPDDLDVFPGGLLETTEAGPGELFREVLLDQFLRIRHGDRFWYENKENKLFSDEEISEINNTSFIDVLKAVTNIGDDRFVDTTDAFACHSTGSGSGPSCQCSEPVVEEVCEPLKHYDYFSGSEASFVATIICLILSLPATIAVMIRMSKLRKNTLNSRATERHSELRAGPHHFYATEWVGRTTYGLLNSREVKINLDDQRMKLFVGNMSGQVVRMIDLRRRGKDEAGKHRASVTRSGDKGSKLLMVAVPGEIDLVLHFSSQTDRDSAHRMMKAFFEKHGWVFSDAHSMAEHVMWREAMTIDQRKEVLARFFKSAIAQISGEKRWKDSGHDLTEEEALNTKLTRTEFADALGLQPQSLFVRNMFLLVNSSGDGFVSFDEFKTHFGILSSGDPQQKADMFFRMFDTSRTGKLTKDNYKKMLRSLLELNEAADSKNVNINDMVDTVFRQLGKDAQGYLTMEDFKKVMFSDTADVWKSAVLNLEMAGETATLGRQNTMHKRAKSFISGYRKTVRPQSMVAVGNKDHVDITPVQRSAPKTKLEKYVQTLTRYVDNHSRQIFWVTLYTLVTIGIFVERVYYYSFEREHGGLRRMTGYGVSVTRGAASAQMFTYASLLVTMSRNTITYFRETVFHRFIPFDSAHDMHIYIAALAVLSTFIHVVGHIFNLYHISTQASSDLNCYFREYFRPTHVLASFHYWTYQTITGLTGIALVLVLVVMYVFATPYARRNVFKYFKTTHNLYMVVYFLMFLHGAARLVQKPVWPYFFLGPMVLFVVDKLVSVSRNKVLLPVHKAILLPSGVINLIFKRPLTFNYQSGQWVRIASPKLGEGEYHPFTLTSAPHEEHLSLHIRAVGPWTTNLRQLFSSSRDKKEKLKIFLDGPFGESHQDWYRYPVSILVGGGIGVTPFASILKDIANRSKTISQLPCRKIYFIWVTRTQQSFEWMTDIIRQVEAADTENFVNVQICITQMKEKYDLRTTMLYICERHFQKIAGLSMFTGLRAKTHFGRPKFPGFFESLRHVHNEVDQIGVFSCGPPSMTHCVQQACTEQNSFTGPSFIHHFENF